MPFFLRETLSQNPEDVVFTEPGVFEHDEMYTVVIKTDNPEPIKRIKVEIAAVLNVDPQLDRFDPHITIGYTDNKKKAESICKQLRSELRNLEMKPRINTSEVSLIMNNFYTTDTIGYKYKINPIELINTLSDILTGEHTVSVVGSRAFGYTETDYDIVVIGDKDVISTTRR